MMCEGLGWCGCGCFPQPSWELWRGAGILTQVSVQGQLSLALLPQSVPRAAALQTALGREGDILNTVFTAGPGSESSSGVSPSKEKLVK